LLSLDLQFSFFIFLFIFSLLCRHASPFVPAAAGLFSQLASMPNGDFMQPHVRDSQRIHLPALMQNTTTVSGIPHPGGGAAGTTQVPSAHGTTLSHILTGAQPPLLRHDGGTLNSLKIFSVSSNPLHGMDTADDGPPSLPLTAPTHSMHSLASMARVSSYRNLAIPMMTTGVPAVVAAPTLPGATTKSSPLPTMGTPAPTSTTVVSDPAGGTILCGTAGVASAAGAAGAAMAAAAELEQQLGQSSAGHVAILPGSALPSPPQTTETL